MRTLILSFIITVSLFAITSCEDIIETNLAKKDITVVAPANNTTTSEASQTFIWNKTKGAEGYNLQIAKPSFEQMTKLVLDTNVESTKYTFNLTPGTYQWRVRAYNTNSYTDYVTYTITVDSSMNLSNKTVILSSPKNNFVVTSSSVVLSWEGLDYATDYTVKVELNGSDVISPYLVSTTTSTLNVSSYEDGWYDWKVKAQNDFSVSPYSSFKFVIDKKAPATPTLILPIDFATSKDSLITTLQWNRIADFGSPIIDNIQIASDTLFANLSGISDTTSFTTFNIPAYSLSKGKYFWRVRSVDAAGNTSAYSTIRRFILN